MKHIPRHQAKISGIWHICGLWLSLRRCHPLGSRAAQFVRPLCCFWISCCIVHCAWCTSCHSLTSTLKHALRQRSAWKVNPANGMARTAGPRRHRDGAFPPETKHSDHNVDSRSHSALQQRSFLSLWLLVNLTNIKWMPMMAPMWWTEKYDHIWQKCCCWVSMWRAWENTMSFQGKEFILSLLDCAWCCWG